MTHSRTHRTLAQVALVGALVALALFAPPATFADGTSAFVESLYGRFAFRAPTQGEIQYWERKIHSMPARAVETHLKNFFFVHACHRTLFDKVITIHDVESLVERLDSGELSFQAVQWSMMQSPEYREARQAGRVGRIIIPSLATPF